MCKNSRKTGKYDKFVGISNVTKSPQMTYLRTFSGRGSKNRTHDTRFWRWSIRFAFIPILRGFAVVKITFDDILTTIFSDERFHTL